MPEFISKSSVSNGTSGGPAFLTTVPVEVENDGVIAGGAGGGGGCACIDTDGFLVVRVALQLLVAVVVLRLGVLELHLQLG